MFYLIAEVVAVSIFVSVFVTWIKLIPRYPKRKYAFIQQFNNIVIQTYFFTILFSLGVYPSWPLLFLMILFFVWLSVRLTNSITRKEENLNAPIEEAHISIGLMHLANASYRLGRTLNFDPATQQVIGDPEAETLLRDGDRGYRAPYLVPEVV